MTQDARLLQRALCSNFHRAYFESINLKASLTGNRRLPRNTQKRNVKLTRCCVILSRHLLMAIVLSSQTAELTSGTGKVNPLDQLPFTACMHRQGKRYGRGSTTFLVSSAWKAWRLDC